MSTTTTTTEREPDAHESTILRLKGDKATNAIKYPRYLPVWEKHAKVKKLTPRFGTELRNVQLSALTHRGLDDLALLAAERGVLVFRNQDFKNIPIERQAEIVRHFGRLHVHPTEAHPEGYPSFRVVYRDPEDPTVTANLRYGTSDKAKPVSSTLFHVDHSAELQPPGVTFFWALEIPETGGDTIFSSQVGAYEALSDDFKKRLGGLLVLHDNTAQIENSRKAGGPVRYEPVKVTHPLIRTHPVTGKRGIFIHGFSQRIVGWKKEESDYLLAFLNDLIVKSVDIQVRVSYEEDTVVVWDNRILSHSAIHDWEGTLT
uniref:TauD/TfdA-like domain-containing protein n=1 Tax=Kwoniella bestiolae CBS 10118 TaxID=1296100 RepID=A0A1B9FZ71_9TREE|nr:hypothetical protein I302_07048 [Kwoniella bestiolae CBS 10118]OCF24062.1 hypothetical protein I302_07048 [Kwoniella bestiolae CBS 10118]